MARKGRDFELAYEWLYELDEKYTVTCPAYVFDKAANENREVDVLVEYLDSKGFNRKIAIECRDRSHAENVMWIEQLIQKREDLGLDFIIATTTKSFTAGAIQKAKYHGVIIEQAEMINSKIISDNMKHFFLDVFFFKFDLLSFNLCLKDNTKLSFKTYFSKLDFAKQNELMHFINTDFYYSFEPKDILENNNFSDKDFFSSEDNSMELEGNSLFANCPLPDCVPNVSFFDWRIKVTPYKITLPLVDSIAAFDGEKHTNKNYRSIYGNEEDYFKIGYLDGKLFTEMNIKQRKYLRFSGMNLELNTIIPDDTDRTAMNLLDYISKNHLGKFDLTHII